MISLIIIFLTLKSVNSQFQPRNILISFSPPIDPIFEKISSQNFSSIEEKRSALTSLQKQFANAVQFPLQEFLRNHVRFQSFWINNKMIVENATLNTINLIKSFPGVASVEDEPVVQLDKLIDEPEVEGETKQNGELTWGIRRIRVKRVWDRNIYGRGVVVAIIDSGVNGEHESLSSRWRSKYGWFDAYQGKPTPYDDSGHGSHVMGIITGSNFIGVAPKSTWVSCKACNEGGCRASALYKCGEWIQCPTDSNGNNEDCSKAPHVVANSWGRAGGHDWYDGIIRSWKEAGIIPVASIGNRGNECGTQGTPGEREDIIGVGSLDSQDKISGFSSFGPSADGRIKPDITAPGSRVRSASHDTKNGYVIKSGTSMACPHVAGVIALMLEKKRGLSYNKVYKAIKDSAVTKGLDTSKGKTCGGRRKDRFPNNSFGWGRIDALNAVNAV